MLAISNHCKRQCGALYGTDDERAQINADNAEILKKIEERKRKSQSQGGTNENRDSNGTGEIVWAILVVVVLVVFVKRFL